MNKTPYLLLLLLFAAISAEAQQLYKSVGPDGKLVYSTSPIDGKTRIATMKGSIIHPVQEVPTAVPKAERLLVAVPDSVVTPDIEETMLRIMELVEFGKRYEPICSVSEKVARSFSEAHKSWLVRNALYIEQQKRLLMEVVSPQRRVSMQLRLSAATGRIAVSTAANPSVRLKWCESVSAGLNSGASDIVKPAMLAIPLTAYRDK